MSQSSDPSQHIDVSIIIPVRNEEAFLPSCLAHVLALETDKRLEIIVVDNGSTDRSAEIASQAGVRVLSEHTPGVGSARARGTREARGTYILHIDADTHLPKAYLTDALRRFDADPTLVCLGGRATWYDAGFLLNAVCFIFYILCGPIIRAISRGAYGPMGNNMIFPKHIYDKTSGFDPTLFFGEDGDLSKKMHAYGRCRLDLTLVCETSSRRFRTWRGIWKHVVNTIWLVLGFAVPYNELSSHNRP